MLVIIGESASGKSTLQKMLVQAHPEWRKIVTYTTRPMRDNETNGIDYHFITQKAFDELVKRDFFVEHATYRGWSYGTAKCDCENDRVVTIVTPAGLRALRRSEYSTLHLYI